jgi:hypothetical protein
LCDLPLMGSRDYWLYDLQGYVHIVLV